MMFAASCRVGVSSQVPIDGDLDTLSYDNKLTAKILRKRQEEVARRAKLLDPRSRVCAVDQVSLAEQVERKKRLQDAEKAEDTFYAQSAKLQDEILQTVETMKAQAARERQMDVVDFSLTNLRKEQRREYALSDPQSLKKETPPNPDAESLGASSFQTFGSGNEDVHVKKDRQQLQAFWLQEQIEAKQETARLEREMDRRYDEQVLMSSIIRAVAEEEERKEQREDKMLEVQENLMLAAMAKERAKARKDQEDTLKLRHVETVRNDNSRTQGTMMLAASSFPGVSAKVAYDADLSTVSHDPRLMNKILKKRQQEMTRRENMNYESLGADPVYIRQQMEDKKRLQQAEKEEDMKHAQQLKIQDHVLQTIEQMKTAEARERQKESINYSLTYLRKEQRREYHLSDPMALKTEKPY
jgi:hypothetical protein